MIEHPWLKGFYRHTQALAVTLLPLPEPLHVSFVEALDVVTGRSRVFDVDNDNALEALFQTYDPFYRS